MSTVATTGLLTPERERETLDAVRREAHPIVGDRRDYEALMATIGDARIVLTARPATVPTSSTASARASPSA